MNPVSQANEIDIISEARSIFDINIEAIDKLKGSLGESFRQAVRMIFECTGKIVVTGVGKSGIIGRKIAGTLSSLGTLAIFLHPTDGLHGGLGIIQPEDIILAIAKSGQSDELLALLPSIKNIGASIISIVGNRKSSLAVASDVAIIAEVEKEAGDLNLAPTTSCTLALVVGDAMAVILSEMRGFNHEDYALYHPAGTLGKRLLLKVSDMMHSGAENPMVQQHKPVKEALVEMTSKAMGALNIVDEKTRLKGIITEGDLRRGIQKYQEDILTVAVEKIMTPGPITVLPETLAFDALKLMEDRPSQISVLPVVDQDGRSVGILRLHDLVKSGL